MDNDAHILEITKDIEPNYLDPNFILQNLTICSTEKLYDQPPFTIRAKQRIAEILSLQVVFYVMLCLKSFIGCDLPPTIVIIGTGTIGNAIIELLTACGCQPYLSIYSRSDVAAKQWRERGYKSHHHISRLMKTVIADIVIFAFNLQSFPSVCRQIIDIVTPHTVCINAVFGLSRKRIYRVLRINTVFRTYVEAINITHRLERELKHLMDDARANIAVTDVKSVVSDFFQQGGLLADLSNSNNNTKNKLSVSSVEEVPTPPDSDNEDENILRPLSALEESCSLIAKRSKNNISNLITLLENYFSIRGMPHKLARREAIESILGDIIDDDRESIPILNPHIIPINTNNNINSAPITPIAGKDRKFSNIGTARKSLYQNANYMSTPKHSNNKFIKKKSISRTPTENLFHINKSSPLLNLKFPLTEIILQIHKRLGNDFQCYFSRYILISDIPPPIHEQPVDSNSLLLPEWPPEPIYFNNILDLYADRRRTNKSIHDEDAIIKVYDDDTNNYDPRSKGTNMLLQLDIDTEADNAEINAIRAPSEIENEKEEQLRKDMEQFGFGLDSPLDTGTGSVEFSPHYSPRMLPFDIMEKLNKGSTDYIKQI